MSNKHNFIYDVTTDINNSTISNKKNNKNKKNEKSNSDETENMDEYINLLINTIDEIKKNDDSDIFDDKLSKYLEMMQNVIDNYYNLCIEKL